MTEFHVDLSGFGISGALESSALQRIEDAICAIDAAAVIDFSETIGKLRVAAALKRVQLGNLLAVAGFPVELDAITPLPSICCGGCSG